MPAKRKVEFSPFAQILERWMKAKPGFMSFADFAEIVELSPQIISEVFTKGKMLSDASIQKIASNTREYDETHYRDEHHVFGEPGIPLAEMLMARTNAKPDLWTHLMGYVITSDQLNPEELQRVTALLKEAFDSYLQGKPLTDNIEKRYRKAANS